MRSSSPGALAPELEAGTRVEHYQVMRLLGRGATGEVYLCRDATLGRRVALKFIRPDVLGSGAAVERFLFEARTTARFNHPHIVTIYAVGQWGDRPYLVLEYLEGQTLRQRMDEERQGVRETVRIGQAIAEALAEAHHNKVLHRDLKPANVLIPKDGRLRVLDFSLAKALSPRGHVALLDTVDLGPGGRVVEATADPFLSRPGNVRGTPLYMAPEQWTGAECEQATDIWALGVILFELIARRRPFEGQTLLELRDRVTSQETPPPLEGSEPVPAPLVELVSRCLDRDPGQRPTARQAAATLELLLHGSRGRGPGDKEQSPFRGLLPFAERHAELFFGREGEIAACLEQLREQGVLPVVGPSGAGKTSFVQAGLIPRLREQGSWLVLQLRPGERPFCALATRLLRGESVLRSTGHTGGDLHAEGEAAGDQELVELTRELEASPLRLNLALRQLAEQHRCRVLLFVDQLEELCSVADPGQRAAFMQALCSAGDEPDDPVRVVFTLRDDFLGRLALGVRAREVLGQLAIIRSPEREALEEIVSRPLVATGYRYDDPTLPGEMVDQVAGEATGLPLLQFTTQALWDRRDPERRLLLRAVHDAVGGVAGALARHAETVLEGLSATDERLARQLLLRLVTPEGTRKAARRSALLEGLPAAAAGGVLDRLVQGRLLSLRKSAGQDRDPGEAEEAQLELIHESLIHRWSQLSRWLDESRDERTYWSEVDQAAEVWDRRGRRLDEVWGGRELQEALFRAERAATPIPDRVAAFLAAGRQRERRRQRRRVRRLFFGGLLLAAVAVVAVAVAISLAHQRRVATLERDRARGQRAAAQREGARSAVTRGDLLQARAQLRSSLQTQDSPLARALWLRLGDDPTRWQRQLGGNVYDVAISPDGKLVAAACQDRAVYLLDARTARLRVLRGHEDQVFAVVFSPDGRRLASGAWDGRIRLWDLDGDSARLLSGHTAAVWRLAFSPDGRSLASASWDRSARIWSLDGAAPTRVLKGHTDRVYGVAFSPDGSRLATASFDRTLRLWDPTTGAALAQPLRGHTDRVYSVAWASDGQRLASGSLDRTIRIWRPGAGGPPMVISGPDRGVYGLAFSPDGRSLASSGWSGHALRLHPMPRAGGATNLTTLRGHRERVYALAYSADGRLVASGSSDKTVRLWEVGRDGADGRPAAVSATMGGHKGVVWGVAFSPDGKLLASGGLDRTVRLWDVASGALRRTLTGHEAVVTGLAFSDDGALLASASADRTVRLWEVASGSRRATLAGHEAAVYGVAFRPGGAQLATAGSDQTVRLWSVPSGRQQAILRGHTDVIWSVAFAPGGERIATASADKTVRLWRLAGDTGTAGRVLTGHTGTVYGVAFSPNGKRLATGGADHDVRIWDLASGSSTVVGRHPGRVYYLAFHPDGKRLGVPGSDGTIRIFGLADGSHVDLRGHGGEVNMVRFSPDGKLAASSGDDGTVRVWELGSGSPAWRTTALLARRGRLLTHRGWRSLDAPSFVTARLPAPATAWERALAARGRLASLNSGRLCASSLGQRLELWDTGADRKLFDERVEGGVGRLLALSSGCAVQAGERLLLFNAAGAFKELSAHARLLSTDDQGLLAATDREVLVLAHDGRRVGRFPTGFGVTAATRDPHGVLALGFREGNIELRSAAGKARGGLTFERVPSSAVLSLRFGPRGILAAGFADGSWGVWSSLDGKQLIAGRLHGPIQELQLGRADQLHVASSLGQHHAVDLSVFGQAYCELLRQVWERVPLVWEDGVPVLRAPPADHPCHP